MKILFLVKRFYTNKDLIGDGFGRLYYFPTILAELGHECRVFALDFKNTAATTVRKANVEFNSIPLKSFWRLPLMRDLYRKLVETKADVVFTSGDSYFGYLGLLLSKQMSSTTVFDMYDDYAYFGSNKIPFMRTLLRSAVRKSDLVVCASKPVEKKYGAWQENTLLVENGIDNKIFRHEEKSSARQKANVSAEDTVVGYFGSIHRPRGVDDLLAAIQRLRAQGRDITLLMAGHDHGEVSLSYPWVDYRGMVSQTDVVTLINSCDVVTVPYKDTELIRMTNACKLMEYIACRIPVVVSDVSDYADYFPESFGCVSRPADPGSLAQAIANQLQNRNVVADERVVSWHDLVSRLDEKISLLQSD